MNWLKFKRMQWAVCVFGLLLAVILPTDIQAEESKRADIVFTSDLHSHLDNFSATTEDGNKNWGGFSRIRTLLEEEKAENPDTLVVDGGDFAMGTLVQTIFSKEAPELRMMGYIGIEATTLGNHEFDYRSEGLADMLIAAKESGDVLPELVVCNIDWAAMEKPDSEEQQQLIEALKAYGVSPYKMLQKGDVNIAVIGVFGKEALSYSPTCELIFKDPVASVKETVEKIQANEDADMIVCLSHSGTDENIKNSEDEILAQEVPELDVILSGHSHVEFEEPLVYGDTYIVGCGEYGEKLGSMALEQNTNGRWELIDYELIPVTEDIAVHADTQEKIENFTKVINELYLKDFGYQANQVLAYNPYVFSSVDDVYDIHEDHNLGNLLSDAFYETVSHAETKDDTPVAVAIVPSGCIRESYGVGELTVEDVFNSYSLGIGLDREAGYPLVSVYLTGKELKTIAEIDASISDLMKSARLYCRGLNFIYNPKRILLNKVTDVYLTDAAGQRQEIEDDKLYRVVADLYSGQMLGEVEDMSYGILSIVPKFADGTPIENLEDAIVYKQDKEIKAWAAIAAYMESFSVNTDGIAEVPAEYENPAGRKILEDKTGIGAVLSGLNIYGAVILLVGAVLICIVLLMIIALVRWIRKYMRYKK